MKIIRVVVAACLLVNLPTLLGSHDEKEQANNCGEGGANRRLRTQEQFDTFEMWRPLVDQSNKEYWMLSAEQNIILDKKGFQSKSEPGRALNLRLPAATGLPVVDVTSSRNRVARSCYSPSECAAIIRLFEVNEGRENLLLDNGFNEGYKPAVHQRVYQAPFSGMILQVFSARSIDHVYETATTNQHLQQLPSRNDDGQDQHCKTFVFEQGYQLAEPLHLELGKNFVPRHALDYAYKPVLIPNEKAREVDESPSDHSCNHPQAQPRHPQKQSTSYTECKAVAPGDDDATSSSWWQWWFPFTTSTWWKDHGSTEADFDMDPHAFAGGSHGEVWRGHRICDRSRKRERERRYDGSSTRARCDEQQSLIFKRLKVDQSYRLLEAGLREVYFGNLLREESGSIDLLFTSYVDHFFREMPHDHSYQMEKQLELWIVFEDAGASLRSYLYTPTTSTGGFVMFQQSPLWTELRMSSCANKPSSKQRGGSIIFSNETTDSRPTALSVGRSLIREILRQILKAASQLHSIGIVHRDIKPSNIMCKSDVDLSDVLNLDKLPEVHCVLGDFSSAWNNFTAKHLYTNGPSPLEQTDEYAPPESYLGPSWVPFDEKHPQSYDSWSIGVLALELLLASPTVFTIDSRTRVLLSNQMQKEGASAEELRRALYLAALSQFCIYVPASSKLKQKSWPLRDGDPLHNTSMVKESCTLQDFHRALRARDPLGIGFDSSADLLLHLIWQLLAWDPNDRISASDALLHPYFSTEDDSKPPIFRLIPGNHNALESQMLDPRLDFNLSDTVHEFVCPKCGRIFSDWKSCHRHANSRRHAKFCKYDKSTLPSCINAHSMLPAHHSSGYCDLQGRRSVIEDFHSIHLHPSMQFYGVFDGHTGNLASKYVASTLYETLSMQLSTLSWAAESQTDWKDVVKKNVTKAFADIHENFLRAVSLAPTFAMDQSGTTATALLVTEKVIVLASLGDSRAVLSVRLEDPMELLAVQLTVDHVASDPTESMLVVGRGGHISSNGGIDRVNGTLAITRSIGDANLAPFLSRDPYVVSMTRLEIKKMCGVQHGDAFPCFVILASDGLWDVMDNDEAVNMVAHVLSRYSEAGENNGGDFQEAAHSLAIEAYVRGSTDNIGVCVISIH